MIDVMLIMVCVFRGHVQHHCMCDLHETCLLCVKMLRLGSASVLLLILVTLSAEDADGQNNRLVVARTGLNIHPPIQHTNTHTLCFQQWGLHFH